MSFDQLLGQVAPGWQSRVKEAAYTSPVGVRIPFQFVDVSRETSKRTAEFEFNGLNDVYIQDNGYGGRKYPLVCFFTGAEHDRVATQFEVSLLAKGVGQLEHPLYGTFNAIPVGAITRRNDLVTGANQSVVEVTFSTTLATIYPAGTASPASEILAALDGFDLTAALEFEELSRLTSLTRQANFKGTLRGSLNVIRGSLAQMSGVTAAVRRDIADQLSTINETIDVLVGAPLNLAQQVSNLVLTPARALKGLESRMEGYGLMLDNMVRVYSSTAGDGSTLAETIDARVNEFRIADHIARTSVGGSVRSTVDTAYRTRPQATAAAELILAQMGEVVAWRDARLASLSASPQVGQAVTDPGGALQALQEATALAAGFLVESSFSLIPERRIVLDRNRTIVDLCGELYGTTSDERLDFLIDSNDLGGDEILELPRGRVISYFV